MIFSDSYTSLHLKPMVTPEVKPKSIKSLTDNFIELDIAHTGPVCLAAVLKSKHFRLLLHPPSSSNVPKSSRMTTITSSHMGKAYADFKDTDINICLKIPSQQHY